MILDEYWTGEENFDAKPAVGQTYVVKPGDTVYTAGAKTAGQFCIEVVDTKPLTEGMVDTGTLYRCSVVAVPAMV